MSICHLHSLLHGVICISMAFVLLVDQVTSAYRPHVTTSCHGLSGDVALCMPAPLSPTLPYIL